MNSVFRPQPIAKSVPPPSVMPTAAPRRSRKPLAWHQFGLILLTFSAVALIFFSLTAAFVSAGEDADRHPALHTSDVSKHIPTSPAINLAVDDPR